MSSLDRDAFLKRLEHRRRDLVAVEVPTLGGTVYVRRLRASELEELGLLEGGRPTLGQLAELVVRSLSSPAGTQLLQPEDVEQVAQADLETYLRLFAAVAEVNGLGSAEELMQGFGDARRGGSSTD